VFGSKAAKFKCFHCGARFTSRRARVIHEATECPERPSVKKK
jgi:hypothetical protein